MLAPSKIRMCLVLAVSLAVVSSSTASADFVRPKGATPKTDPLVISYLPCGPGTLTAHGGPGSSLLTGVSSCPPVKTSPFLTAGTPGVNGQPAQFLGNVRQNVIATSTPDIRLAANMTDVRCDGPIERDATLCKANGPGPPAYVGQTDVVVPIDLTDNCNYPIGTAGSCPAPPTSGTLSRTIALDFPMPCAVPATANVGATCSVTTSWNARFPGIVPPSSPPANGSRMNIEVGQVSVTDGSNNGKPNPNNATFATSGLFSP
jgi:hypothetical protein